MLNTGREDDLKPLSVKHVLTSHFYFLCIFHRAPCSAHKHRTHTTSSSAVQSQMVWRFGISAHSGCITIMQKSGRPLLFIGTQHSCTDSVPWDVAVWLKSFTLFHYKPNPLFPCFHFPCCLISEHICLPMCMFRSDHILLRKAGLLEPQASCCW